METIDSIVLDGGVEAKLVRRQNQERLILARGDGWDRQSVAIKPDELSAVKALVGE